MPFFTSEFAQNRPKLDLIRQCEHSEYPDRKQSKSHRRSRNRDGATDSPFTTMVLEVEPGLLEQQASKAKIIISKSGELLSYSAYRKLMAEEN